MFKQVQGSVNFPELEGRVGQFWRDNGIYEKSLEARADCEKFVFYEGPPTANGMPHPGHCLTRAIKDLFPRYRTMRGFQCERKAGWDTHGLPVEVEVCKELGIHSKEEIEAYGIEPFIHKCQASVWRYMQEWKQVTERLGFWIDLDKAYVTYHQSYVESVWWALKNFFDRDLLYQGHKIVWWWAQGGTALSAGEVGQGYREVADPSVYVRFPLADDPDTALLVWTTTPWTLPSNQFAAVDNDLDYAIVEDKESGQKLILAEALVETVAGKAKSEFTILSTCKGSDLVGKRYTPPFDYFYAAEGEKTGELKEDGSEAVAWRVVAADFVTTESGTGVVHQAPAFGEVDYDVLVAQQDRFVAGEGPQLINAVASDGKFTDAAPDFAGRWVKEADKDISRNLRERGLLFHLEQYLHEYPFCWRADQDPLIQYPRESWFIRTTEFKDKMLANNSQINWQPEHIQDGRFGNFLESNVDWALSRERYWGTPLPIWVCEETGKQEAVDRYDDLIAKPGATGMQAWENAKAANPELPDDLKVHKPYIDEITYDSPFADGARMRRVPEVIDCWFDSGAMPFAQWGYPHKGHEDFDAQFPADFISEAIDQTRGWFYSLLAISTLLFDDSNPAKPESAPNELPHPYRNCIVLGLMLGEDGTKMSKSKRNYRDPGEIFDVHGADALRWYFFAKQPPWSSIIYSEQAIKESIPEFLLRLWNVYSFFVIYATIDGFDPGELIDGNAKQGGDVGQLGADILSQAASYRPVSERSELDRWIISELNRTTATVIQRMDDYDNFGACTAIIDCVDSLSNWYIRRARTRFWAEDKQDADKLDAYWTTYECLITLSKMVAPFVPFLAEELWQNLSGVFNGRAIESVHLCDYPTPDDSVIDETLSQRMSLGREISSLGRAARMNAKLKVRQPLAKVEIVLADNTHQDWLESHGAVVCEELNVKSLEFTSEPEKYIDYQIQPDFKRLGPRVGKQIPAVKKALGEADGAALLAQFKSDGKVILPLPDGEVELTDEDVQVRLQAKDGWAAAQGNQCVVVLSTEVTPELVAEGMARDLVRLIQDHRKEIGCEFTDRIEVGIVAESDDLQAALKTHLDYITQETLADRVAFEAIDGTEPCEQSLGDVAIQLHVKVAS